MNDLARVKIVKMDWLSEEAQEADVIFEFKGKTYHAFGCPVDFKEEALYNLRFDYLEGIDVPYHVMFSENEDEIKDLIPKSKNKWSYSAYGQVLSINPVIVDCGIAKFNIGYKFREEQLIGTYIFFDIGRLDIINE
ncbi:hypothetical protein [Clostridium sp. CF012]|uniref:hypothetical protein n=1 Tax=Clostridium sp. CF012 TaxID=2843319 RepID=UPI001C0B00E6|nr:hypothetical protein [Clostridium sp. CF012]MBU3146934.1 hypothetical protein [Clostridium sp. CF012]